MRLRLLLAGALLSLFASTGCAGPSAAAGDAKKELKQAPDFNLKDANGKNLKLSSLRGKVVLLNFWATWCGPCKIEIPWFMEFERKYRDKGFAVVGVSLDEEGWEVVRPYLQKTPVNYRIVVGDEKLDKAYGGIDALPTTYILDRKGNIASAHQGLASKSDFEDEIIKLLGTDAGKR